MTKTLEESIKERKLLAEEKRVVLKSSSVATELGILIHTWTGHLNSDEVEETINTYEFKSDNLAIKSDGYSRITYNGRTVFEGGYGKIEAYIPGEWETELEDLYKKSLIAGSKRMEEARFKREATANKKISEIKDKFGL